MPRALRSWIRLTLAISLSQFVQFTQVGLAPASPAAVPRDLSRDTLAWAGSRVVTAEDLVRRIELMPWLGKQGQGFTDTARVRAVEALVAEKLLAQEAERQGVGASGAVAGMRSALQRALARDALYRREVGGDSARARSVLLKVLAGRRAVVDRAVFTMLCDSLRTWMRATQEARAGRGGRLRILSEDVDVLRSRLAPSLWRPLIRLPDCGLTLEDVLEDLRFYQFSVRSLEPRAFAMDLNAHLRVVMERDLLARQAIRQHLDRLPQVRREMEMWTDMWRASLLAAAVAESASDSSADPVRWLALNQPQRARELCEVDVEEILAPSEQEGTAVRGWLQAGARFDSLARARSRRAEWSARGGHSGFFPVREHARLGYAAMLSLPDSLVGPLPLVEGYSVFRVLGKRLNPDSVSGQGIMQRARTASLAEGRLARVDHYVALLARRIPVRINVAAAEAVEILPQNMLTRRLLGFGGGMLAAPTLAPMWGWAPLWRAAQPTLP